MEGLGEATDSKKKFFLAGLAGRPGGSSGAPRVKSPKYHLSEYAISLNLRSFWLISLFYFITSSLGCSEFID